MNDKPYMGRITTWRFIPLTTRPGERVVSGQFMDHPTRAGFAGHTSIVVKEYEENGKKRVETQTSIYELDGPETKNT